MGFAAVVGKEVNLPEYLKLGKQSKLQMLRYMVMKADYSRMARLYKFHHN